MLATRRLGQDVFDPPNVKGWPGGEHWITSTTVVRRREFLERALRGVLRRDPSGQGALLRREPEAIEELVLAVPAVLRPPPGAEGTALLRGLVLDPSYQVK